jgi:energy-coupling factor transporter ATP-binding protein EcfA2
MVPFDRLIICRSNKLRRTPPEPTKLRLTPPEPDFTPGEKGFSDQDATGLPYDLLGRKPVGKQLSDLVERIEEPLVIALDGDWGSGKSHFLRLWTGAHRKENDGRARVIYFDAFEHDYLDDPLVGLVGAILREPGERSWQGKTLQKVKSAASKLLRPAFRIGLAAASGGVSELAPAALDSVLKATENEAEKAIDALWAKEATRKQAMQDFRESLSELAKDDNGNPQKLVFIVDELDRCRPDYALSLLEVIKHFFSVPNVHFVLGVNLTALGNSVRARYGAGIDAAQYLQKFVHLNMVLPKIKEPNGQGSTALQYFEAISPRYNFSRDVISDIRLLLTIVSLNREISLRDVERILTCFALLPSDLAKSPWGKKFAFAGAVALKVVAPDLYSRIRTKSLNVEHVKKLFYVSAEFEGDRGARYFWMIWQRLLDTSPSSEVIDGTNGALEWAPHGDYRLWLDRFVVNHIDTFEVSVGGNVRGQG